MVYNILIKFLRRDASIIIEEVFKSPTSSKTCSRVIALLIDLFLFFIVFISVTCNLLSKSSCNSILFTSDVEKYCGVTVLMGHHSWF